MTVEAVARVPSTEALHRNTSAFTLSVIDVSASIAENTLVNPDFFNPDWGGIGLVQSDSTTLVRWPATTVSTPSGTGINIALTCPAGDRTGHWFAVPTGTTSIDVSIGLARYAGDGANTIRLRILNSAGATLKNVDCALSATAIIFTLHTVPADGWAAGDELMLQVLCNEDGRAARGVVTTPLVVTPNGATGVFADAAGYKRIAIDSRTVSYSVRDVATNYGRGRMLSPNSALVLLTNATSFVVDYWSSLVVSPFGYTAQNAAAEVYVGAGIGSMVGVQALNGPATIKVTHVTVDTTSTGGALDGTTKRVEIVSAHHAQKSTVNPWTPYGTQPRAVFVSKSATTTVYPEDTTTACAIIYWDSIGGGSADQPSLGGWPMLIRYGLQAVSRFVGRVINDTMGSHKLEDELGNAGVYANAQALAAKWLAAKPTIVVDGMESNSARDGIDPTAHATAKAQLYDAVRAVLPSTVIHTVTAISREGYEEGSMDMMREGSLEAVYAGIAQGYLYEHSGFCVYHKGPTILTAYTDYTVDHVHPSNAAMAKFATAVKGYIDAGYAAPATWKPELIPGTIFWRGIDGSSAVHQSGGLCTQLDDAAGSSLTLIPLGGGKPTVLATGWSDGSQCLRFTAGGTMALKTSAVVALGYLTFWCLGKFSGTTGDLWVDNSDTETYVYGSTGDSFAVRRATGGGITSGKNVSVNWLQDGAYHLQEHSFNGTHATHKFYRDGTALSTTNGSGTGDPLGTQTTALLYVMGNSFNLLGEGGDVKAFGWVNHAVIQPTRTRHRAWCQGNLGAP